MAKTSSDACVPAFSKELFAPMIDNFVHLAKAHAFSAFLDLFVLNLTSICGQAESDPQAEMLACCNIGTYYMYIYIYKYRYGNNDIEAAS